MFVVLDTDHYSAVVHQPRLAAKLNRRLEETEADAFTTIITVQEITQGWTAEINRQKAGRDQLRAYQQFQNAVEDFAHITILSWIMGSDLKNQNPIDCMH